MNRQEIFNKVVTHLRQQNAQCFHASLVDDYDNPMCAYRNAEGMKCAVGCLIDDSDYKPEMEGKGITGLLEFFSLKSVETIREHKSMLIDLQHIHDEYDPSEWEARLERHANYYNLTLPPK